MRTAVLVAALALGAFAPPAGEYPDWPGKYLTAEEKAVCRAEGGKPATLGPAHAEYCERRYADGGRKCTDSSQCEGKCLSKTMYGDLSEDDPPVVGICQRVYPHRGCIIEVVDGRTPNVVC